MKNIDIDKILYRFEFGISNSTTVHCADRGGFLLKMPSHSCDEGHRSGTTGDETREKKYEQGKSSFILGYNWW